MIFKESMFNLQESPHNDKDYLASELPLKSTSLKDEFWAGGKEGYYCFDQGKTSQCVGYSGEGLVRKLYYNQYKAIKRFAPEFIYGNRFSDYEYLGEGYHIKKALADLRTDGVCFYEDFPRVNTYVESMDAFKDLSDDIKEYSKDQRIDFYYRVDHMNAEEIVKVLETYNAPIWTGMRIYNNIYNTVYTTGIIPNYTEESKLLGGHAVLIVGYKKMGNQYYFIIQNSWGEDVGDNGFFYIPFDNNIIFETWFAMDYVRTEIRFKINSNLYYVNGEEKVMDTTPILKDWRTYIPLRFALENLNAQVSWRENMAIIKRGDKCYYFTINESNLKNTKEFLENPEKFGYEVQTYFFDTSEFIKIFYEDEEERKDLTYHFLNEDDRIMIPVRKIFEYIANCNVYWDNETQEVIIRNY